MDSRFSSSWSGAHNPDRLRLQSLVSHPRDAILEDAAQIAAGPSPKRKPRQLPRRRAAWPADGRENQLAVGQNQWYHFGVGAPPILVYVTGDWDVHWGYGCGETARRLDAQPGRVGRGRLGCSFRACSSKDCRLLQAASSCKELWPARTA